MGRVLTCIILASVFAQAGCGKRHAPPLDGSLDGPLPDLRPRVDLGSPDGWRPPDWSGVPPDAPSPPDGPPDLPAQPDQPVASAWTEVVSSTPGVLSDLWGSSASDVWAVGKSGLILHFDGSQWTSAPSNTTMSLTGIWGKEPSQIYAVGDSGDLVYGKGGWTPGTTSAGLSLSDVWGGEAYLFAPSQGQLRYRPQGWGGYWSSVYLSQIPQGAALRGVWALSDGEVYAVGEGGIIVRCKASSCASPQSSSWTVMSSGVSSHLNAVFGFSSQAVFAVGLDGTILRYDGVKWSKEPVSTTTYFQGVWGSSPTDVYAVGHPIFKSDESVFHYDGSKWSKLPPPKTSYLNAVWGASSTQVFAVGNYNILQLK